jgi:hypothetical protein
MHSSDGTIIAVVARYKMSSSDRFLYFFPSMMTCKAGIHYMIEKGPILPPDLK